MTGSRPVLKFDAELEGRLGLAHEFFFVESDDLIEPVDRGNRGFAHPDDPDIVGFDEHDATLARVNGLSQGGGGHPARRPAPDNHDLTYALVHEITRLMDSKPAANYVR